MQKTIIAILTVVAIGAAPAASFGGVLHSRCEDGDSTCKEFEQLIDQQQPGKIIALYDPAKRYSDASLHYVGDAYLQLASGDNVTPEQEEGYYRKALEVKHYIAYMGLYFFYAQKDEEKALGFLREYVKTKPADTVPYVILGESELDKKHYDLADAYLREGKKVAHAHSPRVDWLLFQANYMLGNYQFARDMFESAVTNGNFEKEIKAVVADHRFDGIDKRPEFERYQGTFSKGKTPK